MKRSFNSIMMTACLILAPALAMAADATTPVPASEVKAAVQAAAPATAKPTRIGSIDLNYVGVESEFGKTAKTQLTEMKSKLQEKVLGEEKKLDAFKKSIESKLSTYTPKQRQAKTKEFQSKVEAFQKLARESEEAFMKEQGDATGRIFSLIEKAVSDYGKANDFAIIVSKKDIIYSDSNNEAQDLTSIILKAVNDSWKNK